MCKKYKDPLAGSEDNQNLKTNIVDSLKDKQKTAVIKQCLPLKRKFICNTANFNNYSWECDRMWNPLFSEK